MPLTSTPKYNFRTFGPSFKRPSSKDQGLFFARGFMAVSIEEFSKALNSLEEALSLPKNDIVRDASIQRFQLCVEVAKKTAKNQIGSSS